MTTPDWQLPEGVDRGLWDYLHAADMVRGYDEQMAASPLARADVAFCEAAFPTPGRLIDYARFNDPKRNRFFATPPEIEHKIG